MFISLCYRSVLKKTSSQNDQPGITKFITKEDCFFLKILKFTQKVDQQTLKNPLKIGMRSWRAASSPKIMPSSWIEEAKVLRTFHCMSLASASYVSFTRGQFARPRVRATAGNANAQCRAISLSTVWAREGSIMDT